jgi:hypothetical protein
MFKYLLFTLGFIALAAEAQTIDPYDYLVKRDCSPTRSLLEAPYWCPRASVSDPALYRAMDWGQGSDIWNGYQTNDSGLYGSWVVGPFGFSPQPGAPSPGYDRARGDGGQLFGVAPGSTGYGNVAYVTFTEDGGGGRQWFCGDGWWLFDSNANWQWKDALISLSISTNGFGGCPGLGDSYTRWRRVNPLYVPVIIRDAYTNGVPLESGWNLDVIISEHYSGTSVANATALERFYFARNLGHIRWESWSTLLPAVDLGNRCPYVYGAEAPGPGWNLVDCRMWTNFVPSSGWSVNSFNWPLNGVLY